MNVSSTSMQALLAAQAQRKSGADPDGGADRAQEATGATPVDTVHLSPQAQQLLAGIAGDADHGADGK
ncbi:MAG TPA: hypothetical protein VEW69_05995 [Alphaproteobacteria bacterium]|nr:hypothetical protein [Alphaproteobacteria bacterium]